MSKSGYRNQWTDPQRQAGGFRRFWGKKPSSAAAPAAACTVTASGSYRCAAPGSSPPTYAACDMNNQTATNLGRFSFFQTRQDYQQYIGWNSCDGNAGKLIPNNASFSISMWVTAYDHSWINRAYVFTGNNGTSDCYTGGGRSSVLLGRYGGKVWFQYIQDSVGFSVNAGSSLTTSNRWYHVGATYDVSTGVATTYLNGASQGTATNSLPADEINQYENVVESAISTPNQQYSPLGLGGTVDDIGVWDVVLDSGAMTALYNGGDGELCSAVSSSNLIHYIDFEVGPGNQAIDTIAGGLDPGVWHSGSSDPAGSPDTYGTGSSTPDPCTY